MTTLPNITIQLVHIQGPLKGEIQDLADSEIRIGRHPDCQVNFPKDQVTLSRVHARIVREGNRFKIIDQSTNGTYVNGKRIPETFLKNGDVIMFSEGGPKVSFLTQTAKDATAPALKPPAHGTRSVTATPATPMPHTDIDLPPAAQSTFPPQTPSIQQQNQAPSPISAPAAEKVQAPFAIQFGPALKSFQTLPIVIGKGSGCDFIINHPAVSERHAQIFFIQNQYWIEDLTGMNNIMINSQPIPGKAALEPDIQLALSPQGPKFRFIGGGRLAEIEDPLPESHDPAAQVTGIVSQDTKAPHPTGGKIESIGQKAGHLFKKFFSS